MENKTTWQKLTQIFSGDVNPMGNDYAQDGGLITHNNDNSLISSDMLTAKSQEELNIKRLELQQNKFLGDQYRNISNDRYQKSVYYETSRLASYMDFETMEYTPEIATALDVMSEESTCLAEDGKMLSVRSNSERIKKIVENLFDNILDVNTNLPAWTRNTCKYGDNFLFLKAKKGEGITKAIQLSTIDITRVEGDGITGDDSVKFISKLRMEEYNTWQIAHFRLIGDDKKLPYGTSVLEKARKIWRMICMAEDGMMVYRLSRAPERRVFKIDVGNMDAADIEPHINKIASRFKRTTQVNQKNGQIDLRYNTLTQDEDYFIPVHNGQNGTVIDTLAGASNLSEIGDIEFLQNKLFAALRVPKPFLGFGEAAGDGKNLAMQDVRFARTVNKIQQAMIQELNKIAVIHLFLLGFEEEVNNFSLSLANPSSQAEMLKNELLGAKLDNYIKAVTEVNGFAPMSMTRAKKLILGMSEDEIRLDFLQQRIEKAEAIRNSPEVLQTKNLNSGLFDELDKKFTDITDNPENPEGGEGEGGMPEPGDAPMPGGGGGGIPPMPGGDMGDDPMGGDMPGDAPMPGGSAIPPMNESNMQILENSQLSKNILTTMKNVDKLIKD